MSEPAADGATAGALLRTAREKQGLHIAALAAAIKVSPRKLDALENDRWQELPDATFTRALAQTVCRTLKIDARPVLDKLPSAAALPLEAGDPGINEPFRERPGREWPGMATAAVRPMVWGALLLLGAAALVYALPADLWSRLSGLVAGINTARGPAPAALPVPSLPTPASAAASVVAPLTAPAVAPVAALAGGATTGSAAPPAPASSMPLVPASATPAAPTAAALPPTTAAPLGETVFSAPPPATPLAVAGAASGLVQLRTSEASWIEVRDARGNLLLSRTVLPGESVGLDGNLPIRLTIGNASATQLGFRGQPVDLVRRTRDNVARVELQ